MQAESYRRMAVLCSPLLMVLVSSCTRPTETVDVECPTAVSSLCAIDITEEAITLCWISPGNDSLFGPITEYDVRYSTSAISRSSWDPAIPASGGPVRHHAGAVETLIINELTPGVAYHFALKIKYESGDWSEISNVVKVIPFDDFIVDFADRILETVIREKLNLSQGPIYKSDLLTIRELSADGRGIVDISTLRNCLNLEYLNLHGNRIVDIQPLKNLQALEVLILGENNVVDLNPLGRLVCLTHLNLMSNAIEDVNPLAELMNLKHLRLDDNKISDVTPLHKLVNLERLCLASNLIRDISPLRGLTGLIHLELDANEISDIGALAGLHNVKNLYMASNRINEISPLASLTNLEYLNLNVNEIDDTSPLKQLVNLKTLQLASNKIGDISFLLEDQSLGDGAYLYLSNNPLSRRSIDVYIPALQERGVVIRL